MGCYPTATQRSNGKQVISSQLVKVLSVFYSVPAIVWLYWIVSLRYQFNLLWTSHKWTIRCHIWWLFIPLRIGCIVSLEVLHRSWMVLSWLMVSSPVRCPVYRCANNETCFTSYPFGQLYNISFLWYFQVIFMIFYQFVSFV